MYVSQRSEDNPILVPDRDHYWEGFAVFNMCPIRHGGKVYGLYRAISVPDLLSTPRQISVIGVGESKGGSRFTDRRPFIEPEKEWDKFGCEDPRVTFFEGRFYTFYTAISQNPPDAGSIKVAVAVSKDFKYVEERHLVTPFNAKAMTLFPERIGGKVAVIFSAYTDAHPVKMAIALADEVEDLWDPGFWKKWQLEIDRWTIDPKRMREDHVEVGAPPIKTKHGWLLVYSHIQYYYGGGEKVFGIEALLLDLKDPRKIIGRTKGPILVPEEPNEMHGFVDNVIFPSGALITKDAVTIYYGAADTTVCSMQVNLNDLLNSMISEDWRFKRHFGNPILVPRAENRWESKAVFNPAAIDLGGKVHLIYRALSDDNTSTFGYASSDDGLAIGERLDSPVYEPREEFEKKKIENANSGCEDPRLTKIGKDIYMCYTAYDSVGPPRVAITSINEKDFLAKKWKWKKPYLITPAGFDDKDTCILPHKFKEGYYVIHRIGEEICGDFVKSLDFKKQTLKKCIRMIGPRLNKWDSAKVGITAPPIRTEEGWLLLYHGVSKGHNTYRVGALLLDLNDPTKLLSRSSDPIFEPEEPYEKEGIVNNVVFPCGLAVRDGILYSYYGAADKVIGVATMKIDIILKALLHGAKLK